MGWKYISINTCANKTYLFREAKQISLKKIKTLSCILLIICLHLRMQIKTEGGSDKKCFKVSVKCGRTVTSCFIGQYLGRNILSLILWNENPCEFQCPVVSVSVLPAAVSSSWTHQLQRLSHNSMQTSKSCIERVNALSSCSLNTASLPFHSSCYSNAAATKERDTEKGHRHMMSPISGAALLQSPHFEAEQKNTFKQFWRTHSCTCVH